MDLFAEPEFIFEPVQEELFLQPYHEAQEKALLDDMAQDPWLANMLDLIEMASALKDAATSQLDNSSGNLAEGQLAAVKQNISDAEKILKMANNIQKSESDAQSAIIRNIA